MNMTMEPAVSRMTRVRLSRSQLDMERLLGNGAWGKQAARVKRW